MQFVEGGKEQWDKGVAAQVDDDGKPEEYGLAVFKYAERWANQMEHALGIEDGKYKLEDVADLLSHIADEEGITGYMYGCAVDILSQVWVHGEALRRWHNAKYDKSANEKPGAVINPALVAISVAKLG
jgi:hypothetical protein